MKAPFVFSPPFLAFQFCLLVLVFGRHNEVCHLVSPRYPAGGRSRAIPTAMGQRRRQEGFVCPHAQG